MLSSIAAFKYAPTASAVATSCFLHTSTMIVRNNASVDTVGDVVSSFVYRSCCGQPSASVLPFNFPLHFSFLRVIVCRTFFCCWSESELYCIGSKTPFYPADQKLEQQWTMFLDPT